MRTMRVLDLSQQLPGPYATQLLAALGASVLKVEPPTGDAARHLDPEMFERVNAGKRTTTLDLKTDADQARLLDLVAEHDVLVEGFRPGVCARLGCDAETTLRRNPALVHCSISGFGQDGPLARRTSHDLTLQAAAGVLAPAAGQDRIGVPWVDLGIGTTAALAIVAAWQEARSTGRGRVLDAAMLDLAAAWGAVKPAAVHEPEPTYGTFATADGHIVAVALLEDAMWRRLCAALGWDDWVEDPTLAAYADRRGRAGEVHERLTQALGELPLAAVLGRATDHDLPIVEVAGSPTDDLAEHLGGRFPAGAPAWRSAVPLPAGLVDDTLAPAPAPTPSASPPPTRPEEHR